MSTGLKIQQECSGGAPLNRASRATPLANPRARATQQRWRSNLLDGEAEALTRKAVDLALAGDITALRLCLDRILPPRKDRPVSFEMPKINNAQDARAASAALLDAVASGNLTPSEASEVGKLIDAYVKTIELTEVLARLDKLEASSNDPKRRIQAA
jgi:hypothetical protein